MSDESNRVEYHVRSVTKLTDARQPGGRLKAVFPSLMTGSQKEEDYVARMVQRDRELGWG
jgi:hypothetical protein